MQQSWSTWTTTAIAWRRAGGRRHYNSLRTLRADLQALDILQRLRAQDWRRGAQAAIARELQVHRSTVSRAVARLPGIIARTSHPSGSLVPRDGWLDD
jgi:uncharacterized membrane protein